MAQQHYLAFVPRPSSPLTYPPLSFESPAHVPVPFSLDILHDFKHSHHRSLTSEFLGSVSDEAKDCLSRAPQQSIHPRAGSSSNRALPPIPGQGLTRSRLLRKYYRATKERQFDPDGLRRDSLEVGGTISARERLAALENGDVEVINVDEYHIEDLEEEHRLIMLRLAPVLRPASPIPAMLDEGSDESGSSSEQSGSKSKRGFLCFGSLKRRKSKRKGGRSVHSRRVQLFGKPNTNTIPPTLKDMVQKPVTPEEYHAYFVNLYMQNPEAEAPIV